MSSYAFSGQPRFVTVNFSGTYDLNAFGAAGGASSNYGLAGGLGAEADAQFQLTAGEKLEIVVGGAGANGQSGGGGGGATVVLANTGTGGAYVPLLIAGGGGGGGGGSGYQTAGGAGQAAYADDGYYPQRGSGGLASYSSGGGGSGVKGNGAGGFGYMGGVGGSNLSGAYAGGAGGTSAGNLGGKGGFGGGGGGGASGGGGGGGYTGGYAQNNQGGLGGTSFYAGNAVSPQTEAGVQAGNGALTLTLVGSGYAFTGAPVFVTIGTTGLYDLDADGASGGGAPADGTSGGLGAEAGGVFQLTAGETLEIVVGEAGASGSSAGGGGGGTFVLANTGPGGAFVPLLVAGGGGGAGAGTNGDGGAGTTGAAGTGSGGSGAAYDGGGGSGVYGNGLTGSGGSFAAMGGYNGSGGYAGGAGAYGGGNGGFGGGGGGSGFTNGGGGGGGGFSGGAGGGYSSSRGTYASGGGTSYDAGAVVTAQTRSGVWSGNGALTIMSAAPCYARGTLILTGSGEVPVEALAEGDLVTTASGADRPIRWIGRRSYAGAFIAGRHLMLPVCIKKGALADGIPHTDLWVSPGHAMFVDGQLVPAWRLINGASVIQADAVDMVEYFHIDLGRHDVVVANGALAESFLDDHCRGQFHNAAAFARQYRQPAAMIPLQRRLEDGFALQAVQARIAARAGVFTPVEPAGALRGFVDVADGSRVCGWAQDCDSPEEPVALVISAGGVPVLCLLANAYRADLRQAGLGSGCHAFDVALPGGWSGPVDVRRVTDGSPLGWTVAAEASDVRAA